MTEYVSSRSLITGRTCRILRRESTPFRCFVRTRPSATTVSSLDAYWLRKHLFSYIPVLKLKPLYDIFFAMISELICCKWQNYDRSCDQWLVTAVTDVFCQKLKKMCWHNQATGHPIFLARPYFLRPIINSLSGKNYETTCSKASN